MKNMEITTRIIPLKLTKHSDRTSILTAFSRDLGTVGFAVPAGSGAGAQRRRALLMALNPLEVVATVRPGRELHTFREPRALMPLHGVLSDPVRGAVAMFLSEVLAVVLRQSEGDPLVFDFIVDAMRRLNDGEVAVGNFHLTFLIRLSAILGIAPDVESYRPGMVFDMLDGCFRRSAPLHGHYLSPEQSAAAERLFRISWENMHIYRFARAQRSEALDLILEYYTLHLANLQTLKSPAVLKQLLGD